MIAAWLPLFLFAVLFGLSMDYTVFILSRIRERVTEGASTKDAVAYAVSSTARLVTGAALIIIAVFVGFAAGDQVEFQQMGFGVAVSLLIDATVVRLVLLPAVLALLGERTWYLPRWLEWLPHLEVEGRAPSELGKLSTGVRRRSDVCTFTRRPSPARRRRRRSRSSVTRLLVARRGRLASDCSPRRLLALGEAPARARRGRARARCFVSS